MSVSFIIYDIFYHFQLYVFPNKTFSNFVTITTYAGHKLLWNIDVWQLFDFADISAFVKIAGEILRYIV